MKTALFYVLFFSVCDLLHSQEPRWKLSLYDGQIVSTQYMILEEDSVVLETTESNLKVSAESITHLREIKKSKTGKGLLFGFLGGALIGGAVGLASYKEPARGNWDFGSGPLFATGALIGGLSGLVVGGLIGKSVGTDQVHDLTKKSKVEKLRLLADQINQTVTEWSVIEVNLTDIIMESNSQIDVRINGKAITLKKSGIKIVRKTDHSIVLALPPKYKDNLKLE